MYNININILSNWLTPVFLRFAGLKALLSTILTTIQSLFTQLRDYRNLKNYELSITSQVVWLEKMLNDTYDPVNARIYIEEFLDDNCIYLFNKSENEHPPYIYNKSENQEKSFISNKSETSIYPYFNVRVPSYIYSQLILNNNSRLNEMKAKINKYKVFGTSYIIQAYVWNLYYQNNQNN